MWFLQYCSLGGSSQIFCTFKPMTSVKKSLKHHAASASQMLIQIDLILGIYYFNLYNCPSQLRYWELTFKNQKANKSDLKPWFKSIENHNRTHRSGLKIATYTQPNHCISSAAQPDPTVQCHSSTSKPLQKASRVRLNLTRFLVLPI